MIARLYSYFGLLGIAAIGLWAVALALLVIFARHRHRNYGYLAALALAVLGMTLAHYNSLRVSAIEIDRREEIALIQQSQAEAAARRPHIRFAEDESASRFQAGSTTARKLPDAQVREANRWDRLNLLAARLTLWLTVLLAIWDYFARFNDPTERYLPLPIAGRWIDTFFPKPPVLTVARAQLKTVLETVVRRGETFLYFGANDPVDNPLLPRLPGWRLPKLVASAIHDPAFFFEAAWFNRYFVIVNDPGQTEDFRRYLLERRVTRASAGKTVRLVWDVSAPLDAEFLALCRDANFQVIRVN